MFKNLKEKIQDNSLKKPISRSVSVNMDQKTKTEGEINKNDSNPGSSTNTHSQVEVTEQKERIKRLEDLLSKCKHTIQSHKERIQLLSNDRTELNHEVELKNKEIEDIKNKNADTLKKLEAKISELEQCISDAEAARVMDVANVKQEMHALLEDKEEEIGRVRLILKEAADEKELMLAEVLVLRHKNKENADELSKLKQETTRMEKEASERVDATERRMEKEKMDELQELRRGKVEALQLMQKQMSDKIAELVLEREKALLERDEQWEDKWKERMCSQEKEYRSEMLREQEEMALASEEQELQRKCVVNQLQQEVTSLQQDLADLSKENKELKTKLLSINDDMKGTITTLTNERNELKSQHETKILDLRRKYEEHVEIINQLNLQALEKLKVDSAFKLQSVIIEKDKKFEELSNDLIERMNEQIKELNNAVSLKVHTLQDKIVDLSGKNECIRLQYEQLKCQGERSNDEERQKLMNELTSLHEINTALKEDLRKMKLDQDKSNVDYLTELLELREENEKLSSAERQLRTQLNETESKLTTELDRVTRESSLTLGRFKDMLDEGQRDMRELLNELMQTKKTSQSTIDNLKRELALRNEALLNVKMQMRNNLGGGVDIDDGVMGGGGDERNVSGDGDGSGDGINGGEQSNLDGAIKSLDKDAEIENIIDIEPSDLTSSQPNFQLPPTDTNISHSENMVLRGKMEELESTRQQLQMANAEVDKLRRSISEKESDFIVLNDKFWQLSQEAKKKITELKSQLDEKEKLTDADGGVVTSIVADGNDVSVGNNANISPANNLDQNDESSSSTLLTSEETKRPHSTAAAVAGTTTIPTSSTVITATSPTTSVASLVAMTTSMMKQASLPLPSSLSSSSSAYSEMEFQIQELKLRHADEIDKLNEEVRKSRQEVQFFKESFKGQFDETQIKMKLMMEKMRENHDRILAERDNLLEIKLNNLQKEKDIERNREIRKLKEEHNRVLFERNEIIQQCQGRISMLTEQLQQQQQHLGDNIATLMDANNNATTSANDTEKTSTNDDNMTTATNDNTSGAINDQTIVCNISTTTTNNNAITSTTTNDAIKNTDRNVIENVANKNNNNNECNNNNSNNNNDNNLDITVTDKVNARDLNDDMNVINNKTIKNDDIKECCNNVADDLLNVVVNDINNITDTPDPIVIDDDIISIQKNETHIITYNDNDNLSDVTANNKSNDNDGSKMIRLDNNSSNDNISNDKIDPYVASKMLQDVGIQVELDDVTTKTTVTTTSTQATTSVVATTTTTTSALPYVDVNVTSTNNEPATLIPSSQTTYDTNSLLLNDLSSLEDRQQPTANNNTDNNLQDNPVDNFTDVDNLIRNVENFNDVNGNSVATTNNNNKNVENNSNNDFSNNHINDAKGNSKNNNNNNYNSNNDINNNNNNKLSRIRKSQERLLSFNDESLIDVEVSDANNTDNESLLEAYTSLSIQPTEIEYLRNILFKYMLGMETKTLTKVICTVMRFSEDEKRQIMENQAFKNKAFKYFTSKRKDKPTT